MEDIYFYRWGNLNPVKHKESRNKKDESMHVAPRVMGVYAFPRGYVERFLIGGDYTNHSNRILLDEDGNKIDSNDFWDLGGDEIRPYPKFKKLLKKLHIRVKDVSEEYDGEKEYFYMIYKVRPHKFEYTGELWHHLGEYCEPSDIIERTKHWVKTSFKAYCRALHKCDTSERFYSYLGCVLERKGKERHGNPHTHPSVFTKDHYEVFIEHIK